MTARGGVPTPPELRNMGPRGGPTYPLGIAERRHRNLPSLAEEHNPGSDKYLPSARIKGTAYGFYRSVTTRTIDRYAGTPHPLVPPSGFFAR